MRTGVPPVINIPQESANWEKPQSMRPGSDSGGNAAGPLRWAMRESDLLARIYQRSTVLGPGVVVGPGDDCAVLRDGAGDTLLVTVDHLVQGRHYPDAAPLDLVARKAVARSVSDIAAMAGSPLWSLATAALPCDWPQERADTLFDRMAHWARHWGCPLVGGDIAALATGAAPVLTVTVLGRPHAVRGPVLRRGARPGDGLYVTGAIGGSLASGRHLTFEPRTREAAWLADTLGDRLHAMIDVSDGVGRDAGRIAEMSGVRLEIDEARAPRNPDAGPEFLSDGEDYELLFAAAGPVPSVCPATGVPITCVGGVGEGRGCVIQGVAGKRDGTEMGWDHR